MNSLCVTLRILFTDTFISKSRNIGQKVTSGWFNCQVKEICKKVSGWMFTQVLTHISLLHNRLTLTKEKIQYKQQTIKIRLVQHHIKHKLIYPKNIYKESEHNANMEQMTVKHIQDLF